MIRQRLLVESLISRTMTRRGPIFMYRRPQGPPSMADDSVDRWIHAATQAFDFVPLFVGDQDQARIVARRYVEHLRKEAKRAGLPWEDVSARLKQVSPHLRRGFQTFFAFYDGAIRTQS